MASSVGNFFLGTPSGVQQASRFNPQQLSALQSILGTGLQGLQNPTQGFQPIAQQARSQFNQQTIPSLAERFTSMGGHGTGALSSPAFASQLGQAGAGLEEGLAALQSQYGLSNQSNLLSLLGMGLQQQHENIPVSGTPGVAQEWLPALAKLGIRAGSAYATGGTSETGNILSQLLQLLGGA